VITGSDFENWRFLLNLGKKKMRDFPGSPGTVMGLILRILQFVFAAASVASMASTAYFFKFTAFWFVFFAPFFSSSVSLEYNLMILHASNLFDLSLIINQ